MPLPTRRLLLTLAALALAPDAVLARSDGYSAEASRIIAQARAATGGKGWNQLRGWREAGTLDGVRYERWLDPLRWGVREELHAAGGKQVRGYNGQGDWRITAEGRMSGSIARGDLSRARTEAFVDAWGFFFPSRFDARGGYVGVRPFAGRSFDVVWVQPAGGARTELWFDRRTHRLGRIVDRNGARPVAVQVSDYRKVGPVTVAFRYEPEAGSPAPRRLIEAISFPPADRDLFSLPRTPPPPPVVEAAPEPAPTPPPEPPKRKRRLFGRR